MRVGLIGLGRWGTQILRTLTPLCDVVACPTHLETDAMLSDSSVNAVVIATPVGSHFQIAERSLLAGKHVFIEKPMCVLASAAERLVSLAESRVRTLFVGHIYIYHPTFERLLDLVGGDEIETIRFTWRKFGTFESDIIPNLVSHDIALALALCHTEPTDFKLVSCKGTVSAVDAIEVAMRFGNTRCVIDIDRFAWGMEPRKSVSVALKKAPNTELTDFVFDRTDEPLRREMQAFLAACEGWKIPVITDGRHGLKVVRAVQTLSETILP